MESAILDVNTPQNQKIPADPAPIIYQMRKPQMKKKKRQVQKPSVTVARRAEKTKDRHKSTNIDFEKKIESLVKANQQLKDSKETLCAEIDELKKQRDFLEMERDRVLQLWAISKDDLGRQKDYAVGIEKRIHNMSTAHVKQITLLNNRIRALALNARMYRFASTQTDLLEAEGKRSTEVQTVEELTRQRVHDVLRGEDRRLAEYIAEIVKEKLHAQSEHKKALVQLEQRLKDENDVQIRKLREDKLKQFEEVSRAHRQQIGQLHAKYLAEKEENSERVSQLQMENRTLIEKIDDLERETRCLRGDLLKCDSEKRVLRDENQALSNELHKRRLESAKHQKDTLTIRELRNKLAKSEDIKEIVLGEFRKLERERDELANAITDGIRRVEGINREKTQRFVDELARAEKQIDDFERVQH